jgi:hypothetical protein
LKKILKKLTWEILKRQVYFNSAIRELLYKFIQLDYENSVKHSEINIRLSQLEQTRTTAFSSKSLSAGANRTTAFSSKSLSAGANRTTAFSSKGFSAGANRTTAFSSS